MTEPYMNLNFIRETMDQIFFEEYEVASFARHDRKAKARATLRIIRFFSSCDTERLHVRTWGEVELRPGGRFGIFIHAHRAILSRKEIARWSDQVHRVDLSDHPDLPACLGWMSEVNYWPINWKVSSPTGEPTSANISAMFCFDNGRQLLVMNETYIINELKEAVCFVSRNLQEDLKTAR